MGYRDGSAGSPSPARSPDKLFSVNYIDSFIAFSPDGKLLAIVESPQTARLLDAGTGLPVGPPMALEGRFYSLAFSPDGKRLATSSTKNIRLWDTETQELRVEHPGASLPDVQPRRAPARCRV